MIQNRVIYGQELTFLLNLFKPLNWTVEIDILKEWWVFSMETEEDYDNAFFILVDRFQYRFVQSQSDKSKIVIKFIVI